MYLDETRFWSAWVPSYYESAEVLLKQYGLLQQSLDNASCVETNSLTTIHWWWFWIISRIQLLPASIFSYIFRRAGIFNITIYFNRYTSGGVQLTCHSILGTWRDRPELFDKVLPLFLIRQGYLEREGEKRWTGGCQNVGSARQLGYSSTPTTGCF